MTTSIDPQYTIESQIESQEVESHETNWWIEEGKPGAGSRPEWMPDKFKSVADIVKSYKELETRVGSAPENYNLEKGNSWIEPDYEPFQEMLAFAKTKHVPQEVMDKMLDSVGKYLDEFSLDLTEERGKLGENAEQRLQILDNWAQSNFSKETYEALTNNLKTADAIKAIEEVRKKMTENTTTIPNPMQDMNANIPTLQDIQSEMNKNLEKYKTDPAYRRELQAKIELASKTSGFQDKQAY